MVDIAYVAAVTFHFIGWDSCQVIGKRTPVATRTDINNLT